MSCDYGGPVAHLVERVIRIDEAVGSNPIGSTMIREKAWEAFERVIIARTDGFERRSTTARVGVASFASGRKLVTESDESS